MISYQEFKDRSRFSQQELLAFAHGKLVIDPPEEFSRLPAPPFLMVDRVTELERGDRKGKIVGEKDIRVDEWFFQCHFLGDPVQPGCLGVDAIWQLLGFYIVACGAEGNGRALGCGEVEFVGQIRPYNKLVRYEIDVRRLSMMPEQGAAIAVAHGRLFVDDEEIYTVKDARVGVFQGIAYRDYPAQSEHSVGGMMER